MQHRRSAPRRAPRPPLLRGGRRAVGHRRRLKLPRTLLGSLGKTARRPAKEDLKGGTELLLVVLLGAAIALALALGYVLAAL